MEWLEQSPEEIVAQVLAWIAAIFGAIFLNPDTLTIATVLLAAYVMRIVKIPPAMLTPIAILAVGPLFYWWFVANEATRQIEWLVMYPWVIRLLNGLICGFIAVGIHRVILKRFIRGKTFVFDNMGNTQFIRREGSQEHPPQGPEE